MVVFKISKSMECIPDNGIQKEIITEILKQPMAFGQSWYLIHSKWFKTFKQYVDKEDAASTGIDYPGPIDNSPLFLDNNLNEIQDDLVEGLDYILVPEEAWNLLVDWYGVVSETTVIKRRVVESGRFVKRCKVEVYPVKLRLCKDFDYANEFRFSFSIADTVGDIEQVMRMAFKIPSNVDTKLWKCLSTNKFDAIKKTNTTVQDAEILKNQLIVIEARKEDGTWQIIPSATPTAVVSLSDSRDAGDKAFYTKNNSKDSSLPLLSSSVSSSAPGYSLLELEKKMSRKLKPGLCGLSNLGNTCFMNCVIQCMSNCPPIANYFINDEHLRELNTSNPLGMKGEIALAFAKLIQTMWSGTHTYTKPQQFKFHFVRFAPQFSDGKQHDSQELLTFLLDGLHEDLNRVKDNPGIEMEQQNNQTDEEMAAEAWRNYKKRNDSIIVDFFHGLQKSTVICSVCNTTSITFDPFCYLSLPLPSLKEKLIHTLFFPLEEELKPMRYTLEVPKKGTVQDLLDHLAILRDKPSTYFLVTEVINHYFHKIFNIEELLEGIQECSSIHVHELPLICESQLTFPVYMWESYDNNLNRDYFFGYPLLISINKDQCTDNMLYALIWRKVRQYYCFSNHSSKDNMASTTSANVKCSSNKCTSQNIADECESYNSTNEYLFSLYLINKNTITGTIIKIPNDDNLINFPDDFRNPYVVAKWQPKDVKNISFDIDIVENTIGKKDLDSKSLNLRDCLKLYTETEILGASDAWYCESCKKRQFGTKKIDLWSLGKVLIIHLKRFTYNALKWKKINTMVNFPLKYLNISEFVIDKHYPNANYDLIGVCNHNGVMGHGHYTAFCQNKLDQKWYLFDDVKVSSVTENDVLSRNAYVLFYMQQD